MTVSAKTTEHPDTGVVDEDTLIHFDSSQSNNWLRMSGQYSKFKIEHHSFQKLNYTCFPIFLSPVSYINMEKLEADSKT